MVGLGYECVVCIVHTWSGKKVNVNYDGREKQGDEQGLHFKLTALSTVHLVGLAPCRPQQTRRRQMGAPLRAFDSGVIGRAQVATFPKQLLQLPHTYIHT